MKKAESERENLDKKLAKKGTKFIQGIIYYGVPLFGVLIFALIMAFGTIPSIQKIFENINLTKQKNLQIIQLDEEINDLKSIRSQEYDIDQDLAIINKIVPTGKTQVAKFVGEISELAIEFGLEESKYSSSEQIEKLEQEIMIETEKDTAAIINIPTTSEYTATFENIENFLNALYKKGDFIIISSLELNGFEARRIFSQNQFSEGKNIVFENMGIDTWSMKVTFEKYQFSKGFDKYVEGNFVSIKSVPDPITLEFIRQRYGNK